MSNFRLQFSGIIKKAEHRSVRDKSVVEVSLCKKNRTKEGDPEAFTWVRVSIWDPPDFMAPKLIKGNFIAGSGDMTNRSYEGKDGKATSTDVRCASFDVDVVEVAQSGGAPAASAPAAPRRPAPAAAPDPDDEPPF